MAIEGLRSSEVSATPAVDVNMSDRAALAMEALRLLGRIGDDPDATLNSIKRDFNALGPEAGETYIQLAFGSGFTPLNMLQAIDGVIYPDVHIYPDQRTYPASCPLEDGCQETIARHLWLPQEPSKEGYPSYSIAEINRLDVVSPRQAEPAVRPAHARLALTHGPRSEEPLLDLLDMPYDKMRAKWRQPTQLDQLAVKKVEFEAAHPNLELNAINLAGFVMIALQRRIEGKAMPASWGCMNVPQLGRKTVGRDSVVGRVYSHGEQLTLGWSLGNARRGTGVGLSVGWRTA